jgi:hypothetical protein
VRVGFVAEALDAYEEGRAMSAGGAGGSGTAGPSPPPAPTPTCGRMGMACCPGSACEAGLECHDASCVGPEPPPPPASRFFGWLGVGMIVPEPFSDPNVDGWLVTLTPLWRLFSAGDGGVVQLAALLGFGASVGDWNGFVFAHEADLGLRLLFGRGGGFGVTVLYAPGVTVVDGDDEWTGIAYQVHAGYVGSDISVGLVWHEASRGSQATFRFVGAALGGGY